VSSPTLKIFTNVSKDRMRFIEKSPKKVQVAADLSIMYYRFPSPIALFFMSWNRSYMREIEDSPCRAIA
jgi:hypothetical protein